MTRILLGMLTPSSNTVLEPMTTRILAGLDHVSAHFSRFRVTRIALSDDALAQFEPDELLRAASLLDDARCQVIGWSGTSASWVGFDADERLCRSIEATTQARAATAVLGLNAALARIGARRIGLVTPYTPDVQTRIIANYAVTGIETVSEVHWSLADNFSFAEVEEPTIAAAIRHVAAARPDAIAILCTNLRGAALAGPLEAELGVPVFDSVSTTVWQSLLAAGENPSQIRGWGRLFDLVA